MDLDLEELAAVIELLDKADFTDFRYEKGDLRIAVRRGGPPLDDDRAAAPAQPLGATAESAPAAARAQPVSRATTAAPPVTPDDGTVLVRSGMLGSFYRAPKPGDPPFVNIGDKVEPDSVVCIVEVMKLMNSMTAGVSGEVMAVHAKDGDLVEFDQPLFSVRPIT